MKAKDRHRDKLLRYLANPDNDWPNRGGLSIAIGLKEETFRTHFNAADIDEMEATGLALRRRRCSSQSALVDKGLMKRAEEGDPAACKLYYQRIEGWSEKQDVNLSGTHTVVGTGYPGAK